MRLRRISIKNFRNLRNITLFPSQITVLIGENNTGKSNLIHALRLIFDPNSKRLESELSKEDINDEALSEGENYFSVSVVIGDLQQHQELEAIFMERLNQRNGESYIIIEGRYAPDDDGNYFWEVLIQPPDPTQNEPIPFLPRMARAVPLYFLDAVRYAERELRPTGRGTLSELLRDINLGNTSEEVIRYIREANAALNENADIHSLADGISTFLSPQMPRGTSEISIGVANDDPSQLLKDIRLGLKCQSDSREYIVARHGTGLQNLTLIAMFRYKISLSGINQPILAIEEPEAHLHPHAQRCLFKELEHIQSPVILTTHSPEIAESCDPLNLIRLSKDHQNQVSTHQLNPNTITADDRKFLARMMQSGHSDAFFAKSIIIVEGLSELITVPAFAEYLGWNFDRDGISLIPAGGNSYSYILVACNNTHFSIPTVVTYDTDALDYGNALIYEAYKSGLIEKRVCDSLANDTVENQKKALESLGWISVNRCFEEEVARIGYDSIMLNIIRQEQVENSLHDFLRKNSLAFDAYGICQFLSKTRTGKRLKIPIATAISEDINIIRRVPDCYKIAIEKAVKIATGK